MGDEFKNKDEEVEQKPGDGTGRRDILMQGKRKENEEEGGWGRIWEEGRMKKNEV